MANKRLSTSNLYISDLKFDINYIIVLIFLVQYLTIDKCLGSLEYLRVHKSSLVFLTFVPKQAQGHGINDLISETYCKLDVNRS